MAETPSPKSFVAVAPSGALAASSPATSYVEWPAILAGAVVASAIAFVLTAFGTALGLSLVSPYRGEGMPGAGLVIAVGLWILWVAVSSFMAGGYVAGRLRRRIGDGSEHEVEVRDGLHGLAVWGVATLLGAALLMAGVYGTGSIAARSVSAAAGTAATAAASAAATGARTGIGEGPYGTLVEQMFGAGDEAAKPGGDNARRVTARIFTDSLASRRLADTDRAYLVRLVATRTGLDEQAAQQRVDQAYKAAGEIEAKARDAANAARKTGIVSAFLLAVSLLIGGAGAWWAAGLGGRHRDEETVFAWMRWR